MADVRVCLVKIKTKDGLRSHMIELPSFTMGRAQDADLPIPLPGVSRLHLRVEVRGDAVLVTDQNSANGTSINGTPIPKSQPVEINSTDSLRLGLEEVELYFQSIPKPFELLGREAKDQSMMGSMEEIIKQVEAKAKGRVEQELKSAKLEAERIIAHAKRETESLKTQSLFELQKQKQELEAENARLQQSARMATSHERLSAQREADELVAQAQKQIQKDYEEASRQMEARLRDVQARCNTMLDEADLKSRTVVEEAQSEANRIRREATEQARTFQNDALKKSQGSVEALQEEIQREIKEKRAALELEEKRVQAERQKAVEEAEAYRAEALAARKILAEVEEYEKRKEAARLEYEKYTNMRADGISKIEADLKAIRERQTVELEGKKRQQDLDIARDRLKALEDIKKEVEKREEDYEKTLRLRGMELAQRLQEKLLPQAPGWLNHPESMASALKTATETVAQEVLMTESSSISAPEMTAEEKAVPTAEREKRNWKRAAIAVAAIILAVYNFRAPILSFFEKQGAISYAGKVIERRKAESVYTPEQDEMYRDTYMDNVLYMKNYFEIKTDPTYIERWTLKLNDLDTLRSVGLKEDDIVSFIAKETNLVQRLGALKEAIDAVYLNEGFERMRSSELEDLKEIKNLLKTDKAYAKIRELEQQSLEEFVDYQQKARGLATDPLTF